tara:strand:+ start:4544 stop:5494 length:951 start_codon:yes stop_codon:yes gene_type:complete
LKIFHKKESTVPGKPWTKEELWLVEEGYSSPPISKEDLMEMLPGRSWRGISKQAHKLGLSRPAKGSWTEKETELLLEAYGDPDRGPRWLAKELGKTVHAIMIRASTLGVASHTRYSEKEDQYIKDNYATKGAAALAEDLGRSPEAVSIKAFRLGVAVDIAKKEELNAIEALKGTDYELIEYRPGKSLVRHIPCGHEWWVRVSYLSKLAGCPNCSISGNRKNTKTFYLIFFPELNLYKVGITGNLDKRRGKFGETSEVIDTIVFETYEECASYESAALKKLEPHMEDTGLLASGNTETFRWDDSSRSDLKIFLDNLI